MALNTVLPELVFMGIRMAVRAIPELNACKFLEFYVVFCGYGMAFFAWYRRMHAVQGKFCRCMAEFHHRFESIHPMAIGAC